MKNGVVHHLAAAALLMCLASVGRADLILTGPDNNPTGPEYSYATNFPCGTILLNPEDAAYIPTNTSVGGFPAATVLQTLQNASYANPGTVQWNFQWASAPLAGGIRLDQYYSWVDSTPQLTQGAITVPATPSGYYGGEVLGLHYVAGAGDPTSDVHFIQLMLKNDATNNFMDVYSVDAPAAGNPLAAPFFDTNGGSSNATDFLNVAKDNFAYGDTQFATFVATDSLSMVGGTAIHTVTLFDGVNTGFHATIPEPGSVVLCGLCAVGFVAAAWWRRRKAAAKA